MRSLLLIAGFGALGALARHGISVLAARLVGSAFPFGTLVVNVVGCLLLGFLATACLLRPELSREWQLALGTGFLGALTTFSTFSVDTLGLVERGALGLAAGNVGLNLVLGLGAAALGAAGARAVWG